MAMEQATRNLGRTLAPSSPLSIELALAVLAVRRSPSVGEQPKLLDPALLAAAVLAAAELG